MNTNNKTVFATNFTSPQFIINANQNVHCLICWEQIIAGNWCTCIRCNIFLHKMCETTYRGMKQYTQCPHCRRVGTIVVYI